MIFAKGSVSGQRLEGFRSRSWTRIGPFGATCRPPSACLPPIFPRDFTNNINVICFNALAFTRPGAPGVQWLLAGQSSTTVSTTSVRKERELSFDDVDLCFAFAPVWWH
jgi:hypothetical protein